MALFPPIAVGTASASTALAADLGKVYFVGGKGYRLVKAAAAITAAAKKVLVSAVSSGVRTWAVNTTTTANNSLVVGVVPAGQTGSSGTTGLLENDYFLIQVSGDATVITVTASTAIATGLSTSTTAGSADPISGTFAATTPGACFAVLTATSAAGDSTIRLINMI